jgi:phosphatidylinositol-3-phosphatase
MKRHLVVLGLVAALAGTATVVISTIAGADSFNPVVMNIQVASQAHLGKALPIKVIVTADKSVLDTRTAPLRIEVKLASECGGEYGQTPGAVLLNKQLSPQPAVGKAYRAVATGSGRPGALGEQTVCAWLVEQGDGRQFANDTDDPSQVDVTKATKPGKHSSKGKRAHVAAAAGTPVNGLPPIKHVFIIVLENESASVTFGADSPAPYLATTLTSEGAFLPNYYGTGHNSNDNYISMISGQPPNPQNQEDCQTFDNMEPTTIGSYGVDDGTGCVYPSTVLTIADQLQNAGLTWMDYDQSMGNDPTREAAVCAHPAIGAQDTTQTETATDAYATRHNPFVYFHSIIDDTTLCDSHVVNLNLLPQALANPAQTPNYVFITPDLCSDGHDATCSDSSRPGGFAGIEQFLQQWVPQITGSQAFKQQNGLLIVTFDEAPSGSDSSSCCGEIPGPTAPEPGNSGPGGGRVGAVLISPCIRPGTVTQTAYNHYSMLRSVEDIFGLAHLGYAQLPGETSFGSDIFTQTCDNAPVATLTAAPLASTAAATPKIPVSWSSNVSGSTFTVQVQQTSGTTVSAWTTLQTATTTTSLTYSGTPGATYEFRVLATSPVGVNSPYVTAPVVVPTVARIPGAKFSAGWRSSGSHAAWEGRTLTGASGAKFTYSFSGGPLSLIGATSSHGGKLRIVLDGHKRTVNTHASSANPRATIFTAKLEPGKHTLTVTVLSKSVSIEGIAVDNLR